MNAIRSLPLINRPSRTSTPAPAVQASGAAAVPPLGPPSVPEPRVRHHTHHPGHLPITQTIIPPVAATIVPRSQSVGAIPRKASPPGSRSATPRIGSTATLPGSATEVPLQGGGHVDAIGLRFNEAVNRALVGVDAKTKKGFRKGAGWSVGESIAQ